MSALMSPCEQVSKICKKIAKNSHRMGERAANKSWPIHAEYLDASPAPLLWSSSRWPPVKASKNACSSSRPQPTSRDSSPWNTALDAACTPSVKRTVGGKYVATPSLRRLIPSSRWEGLRDDTKPSPATSPPPSSLVAPSRSGLHPRLGRSRSGLHPRLGRSLSGLHPRLDRSPSPADSCWVVGALPSLDINPTEKPSWEGVAGTWLEGVADTIASASGCSVALRFFSAASLSRRARMTDGWHATPPPLVK
mmetsp:Transcript_18840/g.58605  ORF Transcript_18840/g.58605 Transcript_18840/m.58605 type:complete len:251 (+) Transcript_18840:1081-1833(+)